MGLERMTRIAFMGLGRFIQRFNPTIPLTAIIATTIDWQ
ncbi:hypothetical protein HPSA20_1459 [Helicobacter pylori SouthAfrica20]|uniref:Uncharacterized protein n=1 Tax=Helicobacter pylori SouthAfrica20 TaxID=1352356 RepID=T1UDX0_HELPX|nr:hypothetical protein HPSA20_1459 [Helicobacter pylori SouthAfrica20]